MTVGELMSEMTYGPVPVDPVAALAWLKSHSVTDGAQILHPVSGEQIAVVALADPAAIAAAAADARRAAPGWLAADRGAALRALADAVAQKAALLAGLAVLESGRTIRQAENDVAFLVKALRFAAAVKAAGAPYGVVAAIAHWSAPLAGLARLVAPALAQGNVVLFKPEKDTALTALAFADIAREVLPVGVFQTVVADRDIFGALAANVDKVVAALCRKGAAALQAAAGTTPLSLWRMRRAPFFVCEEADLDAAAEGAVALTCGRMVGARLFVQESVAADFYTRLTARIARLRGGDPLDRTTDVGLSHSASRLEVWLKDAVAEGAQLMIGGGAAAGAVYAPTLVSNAEPAMAAVANDLFGPVLLATTFRTLKEAAELAQKQAGFAPVTVYSTAIDPALALARTVDGIGVSVNAPGTDLWLTDESAAYVRGAAATGTRVATDAATADVVAAVGAVKGCGSVTALATAVAARADTLTDALIASGVAKAAAKKDIAQTVAAVQVLADRFAVTDALVSYVSPGLVGIVAPMSGPLQGAVTALAAVLGAGGRAVLVLPTAALATAVKAVCPTAAVAVADAGGALHLARHRGVDALWYDGADAAVFAAAAEDLKAVITDGFSADGAWRGGVHVRPLAIASKV